MLKRLFLLAALMTPGPSAQALDTSIHEVLPYSDARRILLLRGFHPFVMPGAAACSEDGPRCYPELVSCVHKRHWICDYTWKSGKAIFQAETNSDVPLVDSFYCLLNCTVSGEHPPVAEP